MYRGRFSSLGASNIRNLWVGLSTKLGGLGNLFGWLFAPDITSGFFYICFWKCLLREWICLFGVVVVVGAEVNNHRCWPKPILHPTTQREPHKGPTRKPKDPEIRSEKNSLKTRTLKFRPEFRMLPLMVIICAPFPMRIRYSRRASAQGFVVESLPLPFTLMFVLLPPSERYKHQGATTGEIRVWIKWCWV